MNNSRKHVVGNWKMNLLSKEANTLASKIVASNSGKGKARIILAPSFLLIPEVASVVAGSSIKLSAQNCASKISGAYTGESSVDMIIDAGCDYCIVGHSERRKLFFEADDVIGDKVRLLLEKGVNAIACVGETLKERQTQEHWEVIETQLKSIFNRFDKEKSELIMIAYEPVWAIGTGQTATPQQAGEVHGFIRQWISKNISESLAADIPLLYGGSVNAKNAKDLIETPDIDGFLVGGASLIVDDFQQIIDHCQ